MWVYVLMYSHRILGLGLGHLGISFSLSLGLRQAITNHYIEFEKGLDLVVVYRNAISYHYSNNPVPSACLIMHVPLFRWPITAD